MYSLFLDTRERIITTHSHTGCLLSLSLTHYQHFIVDKVTRFFIQLWWLVQEDE